MDTIHQVTTVKEFQVVGVSRSGRVRKKSSKLLDFESPEEFEKKKRIIRPPLHKIRRGRPSNTTKEIKIGSSDESGLILQSLNKEREIDNSNISHGLPTSGCGIYNDEIVNLVENMVGDIDHQCSTESKIRQSLYMREKTYKRKLLRDGSVLMGKLQRKDKGKSRYTAYSLWSREIRKKDFPDIDFSNAARRLSELWANVSNKEKNSWRRKAKLQATKTKQREKNQNVSFSAETNSGIGFDNILLNGISVQRTSNRTMKMSSKHKEYIITSNNKLQSNICHLKVDGSLYQYTIPINIGSTKVSDQNSENSGISFESKELSFATFQSNISPIDAAAHLKLLGESLTIIGDRLKEHNGQIALSGSLSVLLDSLICSLGPLLCITTQIPGLESMSQLKTNLVKILDNIAYVMPGL